MPQLSNIAAQMWHDRIGKFLTSLPFDASLSVTYPNEKSQGRIGSRCPSAIMIDPKSAILIDGIDLSQIDSPLAEADFLYGQAATGVENTLKTQINWALEPQREYPMLLVRPSKASPLPCMMLSHTRHLITVCVPSGNFSFNPDVVRQARDYILSRDLKSKWRAAVDLREQIGLGEHLGKKNENATLKKHAEMLELFPLSVWLPDANSGNYQALADALIEKPEVASMVLASKLFKN